MSDPVWITAQESAERMLTIKIAGWMMFAIVILTGIWLIVRMKQTAECRKKEAENAAERIIVTKNIGASMAKAIAKDGGWKEQFFILKRKYDALEAHCENLEQTLASAETGKFVPKEVKK